MTFVTVYNVNQSEDGDTRKRKLLGIRNAIRKFLPDVTAFSFPEGSLIEPEEWVVINVKMPFKKVEMTKEKHRQKLVEDIGKAFLCSSHSEGKDVVVILDDIKRGNHWTNMDANPPDLSL